MMLACAVLLPCAWRPSPTHSLLPRSASDVARLSHCCPPRRRQWPARCSGAAEEEPPQQKTLPTALALGPLFLAQVIGEQYFVPVYLPLLMFTGATEGRIDGPPAAAALATSTLLCLGGSWLTHTSSGTSTFLIGANVVCAALLLVIESVTVTGAPSLGEDKAAQKRGGDGLVRREDTALALVVTLALCAFLTTTGNPVAGLRT